MALVLANVVERADMRMCVERLDRARLVIEPQAPLWIVRQPLGQESRSSRVSRAR
jgi:hypothetical protein